MDHFKVKGFAQDICDKCDQHWTCITIHVFCENLVLCEGCLRHLADDVRAYNPEEQE